MGAGPDTTAIEGAVTAARGVAWVIGIVILVGCVFLWRQKDIDHRTLYGVTVLAIHSVLYTTFVLFWVDFGLGPTVPAAYVALWTSILRVHWESVIAVYIYVILLTKGHGL